MSIDAGTYSLGPTDGTLSVLTGRRGAIAKAGHDLQIEVGDWNATVEIGADGEPQELSLTADPRSLRVLKGTGGIQSLGDDDKAGIAKTINEEVLKGAAISFESSAVTSPGAGRASVQGELELTGTRHPITFELTIGEDRRIAGTAVVKQTDWGIKPYTALFGTLKVADEVKVKIDARLAAA